MCDKKCKNIECSNTVSENRTYCSLKCRNVYVNKYLRDYKKNGTGLSKDCKENYLNNIKKCLNCGADIPYENRRNKFCNKSCSSSYNNIKRKGVKIKLSNKGRVALQESAYKNLHNTDKDRAEKEREEKREVYVKNPRKCLNCGKDISFELYLKGRTHCNKKCKIELGRKNMDKFSVYKKEASFKFNLSSYPEEFDFDLIKEHGWYKPVNRGNNTGGVSRDHIYSVRKGFEDGIDPNIISHPANCQLMVHSKNISKNKRCGITINDLKEKISNWNKKYKVINS